MIECPNCHHANEPRSRFCANCGTQLAPAAETAEPPAPDPIAEESNAPRWTPPPQIHSPEWHMSDPGPLPERPRRRRTWLWIVVGALLVCVLGICAVTVWANTIGKDVVHDFATRANRELTRTTINRGASATPLIKSSPAASATPTAS